MSNKNPKKLQADTYDLIIVGAGPAGLSASIYASRYKLKNVVVGKLLGGLASVAHKICNWPSEKEISGADLMAKMQAGAESLGGEVLLDEVQKVEKVNEAFILKTTLGKELITKTLLIANGTERRKLNVKNEKEFLGKGVSYCSTCDGLFFKNKVVAVIGGSDSANTASVHLADTAQKVYQVYRKSALRGDPTWIEQIKRNEKIEVVYNAEVKELAGDGKLQKIILANGRELTVDGLFVEIGTIPHLENFQSLGLATDDGGYIKVESHQATNIKGVWAAGDITTGSNGFRQVITACAEGAIAAESIYKYLKCED